MKRLLILILLLTLLLAGCGRGDRVPPLPTLTPTAAPTAPTPTPRPTPKPTVEPTVKPISPAVLALSVVPMLLGIWQMSRKDGALN